MELINRYPYTDIKKKSVNGKRLYDTESGPLPSVTTILSATKPQESVDALNQWRNRVGHKEATRITNEAANVGTLMHDQLERWIKGEPLIEGDNLVHRVAKRMANTVIENISENLSEVWGSEVSLYYPGLYAGTADLTGVWKSRPSILDFKQTNKPKKREWIEDYFLQLAAYGNAHNVLFGTEIENAAIFMCSRDCKFQLFELEPDEFNYYSKKWAERVGKFYDLDK